MYFQKLCFKSCCNENRVTYQEIPMHNIDVPPEVSYTFAPRQIDINSSQSRRTSIFRSTTQPHQAKDLTF